MTRLTGMVARLCQRFQQGVALIEQERWEEGLREFEESYRIYPTQAALFNKALCLRLLRRYGEAMETLAEYRGRYAGQVGEERMAEVETELGRIEGVEDYLVAGVDDPQGILTQVPWIFVVPAEPESWSVAEFLMVARRILPPHMVPRGVEVVPSIPLASTGQPGREQAGW